MGKNTAGPQEPKQYRELTFTDNFLFCKILEKNRELCRQLLEVILGITIRKLESVEREKELGLTDIYIYQQVQGAAGAGAGRRHSKGVHKPLRTMRRAERGAGRVLKVSQGREDF